MALAGSGGVPSPPNGASATRESMPAVQMKVVANVDACLGTVHNKARRVGLKQHTLDTTSPLVPLASKGGDKFIIENINSTIHSIVRNSGRGADRLFSAACRLFAQITNGVVAAAKEGFGSMIPQMNSLLVPSYA